MISVLLTTSRKHASYLMAAVNVDVHFLLKSQAGQTRKHACGDVNTSKATH